MPANYELTADPNWKHPADVIEPPAEAENLERMELLGALVDWIAARHGSKPPAKAIALRVAARRFGVLFWLMGRGQGISQTLAAQQLGIGCAGFSKLAIELSGQLGNMTAGAMHTPSARAARSAMMTERASAQVRGDGTRNMLARHAAFKAKALERFRQRLVDGDKRNITQKERELLRAAGYLQPDADVLTAAGKLWVQEIL